MGSGGTFCPQKSFESTGSRRERAHPLDGCQESIACATSEHGSRRDGSRSGVALGFERATWARRRGRPVGRVRSAPSRRAGSIRPLAGAAARPAAAVVPAAASASASRANWLAFDERPSSQNPDYHLNRRARLLFSTTLVSWNRLSCERVKERNKTATRREGWKIGRGRLPRVGDG